MLLWEMNALPDDKRNSSRHPVTKLFVVFYSLQMTSSVLFVLPTRIFNRSSSGSVMMFWHCAITVIHDGARISAQTCLKLLRPQISNGCPERKSCFCVMFVRAFDHLPEHSTSEVIQRKQPPCLLCGASALASLSG